ncbi:MAG: helix-turn-helix transcriptional regulator [Bacteroidetes bacterium]|nr:helix-turn-helix transcriptional regulator [Bacteroidota bacterium]MBS1686916.1 helix-turn-helix transcriptional regulator [Bacteroidota bacterium]
MKIEDLNSKKVPIVQIDDALAQYKSMPVFQDKVDKANSTVMRVGLPLSNVPYNDKPPVVGKFKASLMDLTPREREILRLIGEGYTSNQIAHTLQITTIKVYTHRKDILQKTGAKNILSVVIAALYEKLFLLENELRHSH